MVRININPNRDKSRTKKIITKSDKRTSLRKDENRTTENEISQLVDVSAPNNVINQQVDLNYTHVIITRFSYRFTKNAPIGNLFDGDRMKRRLQLFEAFCFPSVIHQSCKDFYWVLIIDSELPSEYFDYMNKLIEKFYESPEYNNSGPRKIFLYKWTHTHSLSSVEWIREIIDIDTKKYLITTRFDDDDSLCRNFTKRIKSQSTCKISGFLLVTYANGYYWYPSPYSDYGIYKPQSKPYIAIGLTLITDLKRYPLTIYFGNHTKLVSYIRNYSAHPTLKRLCDKNGEVINERNYRDKFTIIAGDPVYIRTVHDHNLQKGLRNIYKRVKGTGDSPGNLSNLAYIHKNFSLNLKKVNLLTKL